MWVFQVTSCWIPIFQNLYFMTLPYGYTLRDIICMHKAHYPEADRRSFSNTVLSWIYLFSAIKTANSHSKVQWKFHSTFMKYLIAKVCIHTTEKREKSWVPLIVLHFYDDSSRWAGWRLLFPLCAGLAMVKELLMFTTLKILPGYNLCSISYLPFCQSPNSFWFLP